MESWRPESDGRRRPDVVGARNLLIALGLHGAAFLGFYLFAALHGLFESNDVVEPIELIVIVNENLDGEEDVPPPLKNPEPEPPKPEPPKPKPIPKKIEEPKPLEQIVTNIVVKKEAPKKKEEPKKKDPPKKEEPKKPEEPKKTPKELKEERMRQMRESAVVNNKPVKIEVKDAKLSGNGRTSKKNLSDAEIRKLLNQGYKPGTREQLAKSDAQLGISLIKMALDDKWNQVSPKVGKSGTVLLSVRLNSSGGFADVKLKASCGDRLSDEAALTVARKVLSVRGLPPAFQSQFRSEWLTIRYEVSGL